MSTLTITPTTTQIPGYVVLDVDRPFDVMIVLPATPEHQGGVAVLGEGFATAQGVYVKHDDGKVDDLNDVGLAALVQGF